MKRKACNKGCLVLIRRNGVLTCPVCGATVEGGTL